MNSKRFKWLTGSVSMVIVLLTAACTTGLNTPAERSVEVPFIFNESEMPDAVLNSEQADEAAILVELSLENGSVLRFINESVSVEGGGIGMLELVAPEAPPLLASIQEEAPTPLEVFLLVAPQSPASAKLIEHHQDIAAHSNDVSREPRPLSLDTHAGEDSLEAQATGLLYSWCPNAQVFETTYRTEIHFKYNFRHYGFGRNLWGVHYGVTGVSDRRALSVCNHWNAWGNVVTRVEVQVGANLWSYVAGTTYNLGTHRGMWYRSEGFAAARYRIKATGQSGAFYSIAGSWGRL